MRPRLVQFYEHCLVPEIVDSRYVRSMPIRDPSYILEAQNVAMKRKQVAVAKMVTKKIRKELNEGEPR
jgi:hypothetical protein